MSTEVIIALIGVASTIVSWALGRRRTNAEIANMQMDYIKKADIFYNERIDALQEEVSKQATEIRALRVILNRVIDNACLEQKCSKRIYYNPDTLSDILTAEGITLKPHEARAK